MSVAIAWILLSGCSRHITAGRQANELEFAYSYFASDMKMPEICEKIAPDAYLAAALNPRGLQISYTRSDCYFHLALATRDKSHCSKVAPKPDLLLDGSNETREDCEREVASGAGLNSGGGDPDLLLRSMGYLDEQLSRGEEADRCFFYPGMDDYHFLGRIPPEFRERVRFLPDFSAGPSDLEALLAAAREHDRAYRRTHVDDRGRDGKTALHGAAYRGNVECMTKLLDMGASLDVKDANGAPVLYDAASGGHVEAVKFLLGKGADPNEANVFGQTPMHGAASNGSDHVIPLLLAAGAKIDTADRDGRTPLSWSAERGKEKASAVLLDQGADTTGRDSGAVLYAVQTNSLETLRRLLQQGATLDVTTDDGQTPLHVAAFYRATCGSSDTLKFLLERGASVNARTNNGLTPLHQAARGGSPEAFRLLLDHGADSTLKDSAGKTAVAYAARALERAIREESPRDVAMLLDMGVPPDAGPDARDPPLHTAVNARNYDAVAMLLLHGASPNVKNRAGKSPLELARISVSELDYQREHHACTRPPGDPGACSAKQREEYLALQQDREELRKIIKLLSEPRS